MEKNNMQWICDTAGMIRDNVQDENILITTGGGSAAGSVQDLFFQKDCPIDVISVHDYNEYVHYLRFEP